MLFKWAAEWLLQTPNRSLKGSETMQEDAQMTMDKEHRRRPSGWVAEVGMAGSFCSLCDIVDCEPRQAGADLISQTAWNTDCI